MRGFITESSKPLRHGLVKRIAPKLYADAFQKNLLAAVPRPMVEYVRRFMGHKPLRGVEIGVAGGINAESILETLNVRTLFLIDPYEPYIGARTGELLLAHNQQMFLKMQERLARFHDRIVFVGKKSEDAVELVPEGLDFVYIDGNHSYSFVRKDIEAYYPKVRSGGVIGGHDFQGDFLGVIKAVMEFSRLNDLALSSRCSDWWIHKKEE